MSLLNSFAGNMEPLFEPLSRRLRFDVFGVVKRKVMFKNRLDIFDFGCGPSAPFYKYLIEAEYDVGYTGLDPLNKKDIKSEDFTIKTRIEDIGNNHYDIITMFAVLEHLNYPDFDFKPIVSKLKKGGFLLLTTPTVYAKPVLEFLSYKLRLVSQREIDEHKHYFSKDEIIRLFSKKYGLKFVCWSYFELFMNQYALFKKA